MSTEEKPAAPASVSPIAAMQTPTTRLHTFPQLLDELEAGAVKDALSVALNNISLSSALHQGKGELLFKVVTRPIKGTSQVELIHTLAFKCPTARGKKSEETGGEAVMFVQKGGGVTPFHGPDQLELELPANPRRK
jgi:hypothetical protein